MWLSALLLFRKARVLMCLTALWWAVQVPALAQPADELLVSAQKALENGDYTAAARRAEAALQKARQLRQPLPEARALRLRASVYQATEEFPAGLPLLLQALKLFEAAGNIPEVINTNLTLIEFYRASANPDQGFQLYQRTRPFLNRGLMDARQAARLFHRAAACANESGRSDSVIALSERSLGFSRPAGLDSDMATSYNEMGFYYASHNQPGLALRYLHLAEAQAVKLRHWPQVLNVLRNIMLVQISSGQLAEAESTMARMKAVPQDPPVFRQSHDFLLLQASLRRAQGRLQEAYEKLDSALVIQRELFTQQHDQHLNELNARFQTERAELLARQSAQRALASRQERNLYLASTLAIAALLCLLALAFVRLRQRSRRLEEQRQAIQQINGQLSATLGTQRSLYNELDHRVKNNLSVLSSLIYLQAGKASGPVQEALRQTHSRIESMALLHQELLSPSAYEQNQGLHAYINRLLTGLHATFGRADLEVTQEVECPPVLLSPSLATSLGLVLNELVTNSYKHAFRHSSSGYIKTAVHTLTDGLLHLTYTDSGPGLPYAAAASHEHTLGLSIIKLLVEQHQGSFRYERYQGRPYFYLTFCLDDLSPAGNETESTADRR